MSVLVGMSDVILLCIYCICITCGYVDSHVDGNPFIQSAAALQQCAASCGCLVLARGFMNTFGMFKLDDGNYTERII
jgi:hypothetical protein